MRFWIMNGFWIFIPLVIVIHLWIQIVNVEKTYETLEETSLINPESIETR